MNLFQLAKDLRIVNVWANPNETGWVTPAILYDPAVLHNGVSEAPVREAIDRWVLHGTAGSNTLQYWGEGGSAIPGNWTLANMLVPHEQTVYKDGRVHDTTNVVFKMVKDGYACNHTGRCSMGVTNENAFGVEYESAQKGLNDISQLQIAKGALVYAHDAAAGGRIPDAACVMHGVVAVPYPRRRDPFAGPFDISLHWELVRQIRGDARIWQYWNVRQPSLGGLGL